MKTEEWKVERDKWKLERRKRGRRARARPEPNVLPRLFDAFEQGGPPITRQSGGLGLGLAISKAMVEMHGGTIHAQSAGKGKGATFTVRLPLLAAGAAMAAPSPIQAAPAGIAARPLRILLVEDHGDTARIMCRVLSAAGHKVRTAADVATALRFVEEQPFDLLLSDLGLSPGLWSWQGSSASICC